MTRRFLSKETRTELRQWLNWLWPDDPAARLQDRAERLRHGLRQRLDVLVQQRAGIDGLQQRLAQEEKRIGQMPRDIDGSPRSSVQISAWDRALILEEARQRVVQGRDQLRSEEEAYQQRLAEVDRLKRQLADVQDRLRLARLRQA